MTDVNPDALALGYALQCSLAPLRKAAVAHVSAAIRAHDGRTTLIAEALGINRKTYARWLDAYPGLLRTHESAGRREPIPGVKR